MKAAPEVLPLRPLTHFREAVTWNGLKFVRDEPHRNPNARTTSMHRHNMLIL